MTKICTISAFVLLCLPFAGFGQCSGQYRLTYPSGSGTTSININNGSGPTSGTYCPGSPAAQQLVVVPQSPGSIRLDRTLGGTTTTLQTYTAVAGQTYTFALPSTTSRAVYTFYSVISCNNAKNSTVTLTLAPTLTLDATSTTVCSGSTSTLTSTGSTSGTYTWSAPGVPTVTNAGTLVAAPTATTTYTVTAPTSCSASTQQQVTLTVPTLTATASPSSVCSGGAVTLTAASNVAGTTYAWTAAGTAVGTGASITVNPTASTTYRVTTNNPSACANTSFRDVAVTVVTPAVTITSAAPTVVSGDPVTLTATSTLSGATFTWRSGSSSGPVVGSGPSFTVTPTNNTNRTTTVTYAATAVNGTCSASRNVTVTVLRAPLPVELVAFAAQWSGPAPLLTWATASELRNAYFQVERSADGRAFEAVGRVAAQGDGQGRTDYRFTDATAPARLAGTVRYYRLRQVDTDGGAKVSEVRAVKCAATATDFAASVFPNPVVQDATLRFEAPAAGPVSCTVFDALGRAVFTQAVAPAAGVQEVALPATATPQAGVYRLVLRQGDQQQMLRLNRQ